jgi:hypothetical protein
MVEQRGLCCCHGNDGRLLLDGTRWRGDSVVVEKQDFDAACSVDDFGDVALHSFDHVHSRRAGNRSSTQGSSCHLAVDCGSESG